MKPATTWYCPRWISQHADAVRLYLEAAIARLNGRGGDDRRHLVLAADQPAVDFTRIYPFTAGEGGS
jgi:hypothetical protein